MQVLLGSHDTKRIQMKFDYNQNRVKLASLFPFVYPGAPCIYYGDEVGLDGGKDPDCRRAFPWDQDNWNHELRDWFKKLIQIRRDRVSLRHGDYHRIAVGEQGYAFSRTTEEECALVVMNLGEEETHFHFPPDIITMKKIQKLTDALSDEIIEVNGTIKLTLAGLSAKILIVE